MYSLDQFSPRIPIYGSKPVKNSRSVSMDTTPSCLSDEQSPTDQEVSRSIIMFTSLSIRLDSSQPKRQLIHLNPSKSRTSQPQAVNPQDQPIDQPIEEEKNQFIAIIIL